MEKSTWDGATGWRPKAEDETWLSTLPLRFLDDSPERVSAAVYVGDGSPRHEKWSDKKSTPALPPRANAKSAPVLIPGCPFSLPPPLLRFTLPFPPARRLSNTPASASSPPPRKHPLSPSLPMQIPSPAHARPARADGAIKATRGRGGHAGAAPGVPHRAGAGVVGAEGAG
ncbi:hypothetical protein DFH08DRAFT_956103 [Mycena albidolilacea]|uniref:Uncharacterized protein n=1 Tax=Mycena albidolilacea TaxID=1033008 RepID=A0AAD7EUK7_9AGAR|nr:hypothetical protein DFH08DRAFT_956103 [Mycena albidolilacea]